MDEIGETGLEIVIGADLGTIEDIFHLYTFFILINFIIFLGLVLVVLINVVDRIHVQSQGPLLVAEIVHVRIVNPPGVRTLDPKVVTTDPKVVAETKCDTVSIFS